MFKTKKADISMNTIIYAAIAVLILVLVVGFVTKGFTSFGGGLGRISSDLKNLQKTCQIDCQDVKNTVQSVGLSAWGTSDYCSRQREYDANGNGQIDVDDYIYCWNDPIKVGCSVVVQTGGDTFSIGFLSKGQEEGSEEISCWTDKGVTKAQIEEYKSSGLIAF